MVLSSLVATMVLAPGLVQDGDRYTKDLLPVGSMAPAFSLTGVKGGTASFEPGKENLKGYVVVFWHTGDRMASVLLPYLQGVEKESGKKIRVIAVNHGDGKDRTDSFLKENKLDLICAVSMPNEDKLADRFGVRGFPTVYVMNGSGVIVYRDHKPSTEALGAALNGL